MTATHVSDPPRRPLRGNEPFAPVERFYSGLATLTPVDWLRMAMADFDEYQRASAPGLEAIVKFAAANHGLEARRILQMAQDTANRVADELWPDLDTLRIDMQPFAEVAASHLPEEHYKTFRSEATRRVFIAAGGIALADHLTAEQLVGVYSPFDRFVPLSSVLNPVIERDRSNLNLDPKALVLTQADVPQGFKLRDSPDRPGNALRMYRKGWVAGDGIASDATVFDAEEKAHAGWMMLVNFHKERGDYQNTRDLPLTLGDDSSDD